MPLFVQTVNGEVKQVWDTQPPAGEAGWNSAIEVRPAITANRQVYDGHTFDLTKNPVEIVYAVRNVPVAERKASMESAAKQSYLEASYGVTQDELINGNGNIALIAAAKIAKDQALSALAGATTHDDLDIL